VGFAIMIPILSSPFMKSRIASAQSESASRSKHWAQAIGMMDRSAITAVFGMGLGSFPRTFLLKDGDAASATFSYRRENGNGFLRLGSGKALYLEQRVPVEAGRIYTLALDLRSVDPQTELHVPLCEKSLQYSFRCKGASFRAKASGNRWEHQEVTFTSDEVGSGSWPMRRPVLLSLTRSRTGGLIDVDNVRLLDERGQDLIVNGDFSRGGARWHFSADDHLPWHIFSLWVQILFEQGWLGVLAVAVAVVAAIKQLGAGVWKGEWRYATLLAALCGFLLTGVTESLFDGPRVAMLFFLLLFIALLRPNWSALGSSRHDAATSQIGTKESHARRARESRVEGRNRTRGAHRMDRDIRHRHVTTPVAGHATQDSATM
jgi:hypothetical protein